MLTSCLTGRTAHVRIPSVPDTKREGQLRVDFTHSPSRPRMPLIVWITTNTPSVWSATFRLLAEWRSRSAICAGTLDLRVGSA